METVVNAPSRVTSLTTGTSILTKRHLAMVKTPREICITHVEMLEQKGLIVQ